MGLIGAPLLLVVGVAPVLGLTVAWGGGSPREW
jgi:hypothetical protein